MKSFFSTRISKLNLLMTLCALVAILLGSVTFGADRIGARPPAYTLAVDALENCLDLSTGTISSFASLPPLKHGRYVVSITKNTMQCDTGSCPIDTVMLFNLSMRKGSQPVTSNSIWGVSVANKSETTITIDSAGGFGVTDHESKAYVVDPSCKRNSGSATLTFRQL